MEVDFSKINTPLKVPNVGASVLIICPPCMIGSVTPPIATIAKDKMETIKRHNCLRGRGVSIESRQFVASQWILS